MKREVLSLVSLIFLIQLANGCGGGRMQTYSPRFLSPAEFEKAPPSELTIALVSPRIGQDLERSITNASPDRDGAMRALDHVRLFQSSLGKELERLFNAKGFKVLGPFPMWDEMTFPQKKQSDFALHPLIDFRITTPQKEETFSVVGAMFGSAKGVKWEGPCQLSGFVSFDIYEPVSAQKIWSKKLDLPGLTVDCTTKRPKNMPVVYSNAVGHLLERAYKEAVGKVESYFSDREELDLLKKQSLELREKKVF